MQSQTDLRIMQAEATNDFRAMIDKDVAWHRKYEHDYEEKNRSSAVMDSFYTRTIDASEETFGDNEEFLNFTPESASEYIRLIMESHHRR